MPWASPYHHSLPNAVKQEGEDVVDVDDGHDDDDDGGGRGNKSKDSECQCEFLPQTKYMWIGIEEKKNREIIGERIKEKNEHTS